MFANRALLKIIFAVNVRGKTATKCGFHRPRDDWRPPAIGFDTLPQLLKSDTRLAPYQAGSRIPCEDLIHGRHVQHNPATIQGGIVITFPCTTRSDSESCFLCQVKDLKNFFGAGGVEAIGWRT